MTIRPWIALLMNIFNPNINADYLTYLTKNVIQPCWMHEQRERIMYSSTTVGSQEITSKINK